MRFRFPIVIIDEDFRSENASGLGIRALAKAIEAEGVEILGVTTFGDVSSFAQQQSHASAFVLSVDDEELAEGNSNEETIEQLAAFVREIRRRNADIPIFLYGETRTTHHMPNDLLRELHGFIHMFEDTPEFVARYIIREARVYLDALAPPFFRALTHYAQDGSYSWHCPGHSGGVAFLKSPVGRMFHQFFGENMLRADVCNSVDELGQLLDHTGPVAASERNAARIFGADHLFFVTNGTSTSNKIVWHYVVAPNDVVIVDRNCHKSVLHAITMTGAIPLFLTPTRNHYGIIGPIALSEFKWKSIAKKIARHPLLKNGNGGNGRGKPRVLTLTQSTYDGILYNVETINEELDGKIDTLHFDEAWLPHAAFHDFYRDMHAIGGVSAAGVELSRRRNRESMIFSTQSTHKMLAGLSQASQILIRNSENESLDRFMFNEAFLMHTSTSPQYAIIASCDVAAAMMEPPGGTALVEESITEALDFRRAMRKVGDEYGDSWWFKVWGPKHLPEDGIGTREDWILKSGDDWHGFGEVACGLQHARSDQGDRDYARTEPRWFVRRSRYSRGGRHAVLGRTRHHRRENRAVFVLHHVHDRHHQGPLEHDGHRAAAVQGRLRQEPAALARDAGVPQGIPAVRENGAAPVVRLSTSGLSPERYRAPYHRDLFVRDGTGVEAHGRLRADGAQCDRSTADRRARRPRDGSAADAVPARHPIVDSRGARQRDDCSLSAIRARFERALSRLRYGYSRAGKR